MGEPPEVNSFKGLGEATAVRMAVNAVTAIRTVIDMPMTGFGPSPTALDLP